MSLCCLLARFHWAYLVVPLIFAAFYALRFYVRRRKQSCGDATRRTVAFFHPYCNAGGGGERVLWCAIQALQEKHNDVDCVVYTGDVDANEEEILAKATSRFGITFMRKVRFVYLRKRRLVEASLYPVFTLLGQSLGGLVLGIEAMFAFVPDVFIDSMGYSFTAPLFRYVAVCPVVSYVHYPTISTDMLNLVADRRPNFNNSTLVSRSWALSQLKLVYYKFFAFLYGLVGRCNDVVMVNSTWTYGHIIDLWRRQRNTSIVYPPCDVDEFKRVAVESEKIFVEKREIRILSVGQFRPEKDHRLQLASLKQLKDLTEKDSEYGKYKLTLVLIGGCRNDEDQRRVDELKDFAENELKLKNEEDVEWKLNATFGELKTEFGKALIGIHTMWNEHFGIGVVESMAAGNIVVAHNSGGPKMDIINIFEGKECGFLASTSEEYAEIMLKIIRMPRSERDEIREAARRSVDRFSTEKFKDGFVCALESSLIL